MINLKKELTLKTNLEHHEYDVINVEAHNTFGEPLIDLTVCNQTVTLTYNELAQALETFSKYLNALREMEPA
jgi:hypothetical protein